MPNWWDEPESGRTDSDAPFWDEASQSWKQDKDRADKYWPEIETIIRSHLGEIAYIHPAELQEDATLARDYIVDRIEVASRLRWTAKIPHNPDGTEKRDVSIRSWRANGRPYELPKILQGLVRWYVFGWITDGELREWVLLDMDIAVRKGLLSNRTTIKNPDGTTGAIYIPIREFVAAGAVLDGEVLDTAVA